MTDIGPTQRSTEDLESQRAQVTEESPTSSPVSWRLRQKVSIPERMRGFVERPRLVDRCILADHRVSVLLAPAGFGKTTLLAESCRRLMDRGVHVAWLSLDALDEPAQLVAHLAFALTESGIQFGNLPGEDRLDRGPTEQRANLLIRGIESHRASWVLALDGLENLTNRGSAELINFLVKWSPPNLRIAMACRALPPGLDTFNPLFEGKVSVLTANELRFSNTEIAEFLSLKATSPKVASIAAATEGWPIALRIHRNEWKRGAEGSIRAVRALAENWLDSWFWSRLSDANRRLLRDIGLFEWVDGELLDQVLETRELLPRLKAIQTLAGLFEPVAGVGSDVWALHPMIREHCAKRCFQEAPERFEAVHLRLAAALARRGETISAIHHAATVGDTETVGRILNDHGGVRMWIRQGFVRLQAADRFVTEEVAELYPRVALMHCVVLCLSGRLEEAKQTYRALAGNTRRIDQLSAQEREQFRCDLGIVQGVMTSYGCELADSEFGRTAREYLSRMADERSLDPLIRSMYEYGLCVLHSYRADFDTAMEWANRAHQRARAQSPYLEMQLHVQMGSIAMARGDVKAAARCYSNGQRIAKSAFDGDPGALATCGVMMRELEVERGRISPMRLPFPIPKIFAQDGCPFGSYAAVLFSSG